MMTKEPKTKASRVVGRRRKKVGNSIYLIELREAGVNVRELNSRTVTIIGLNDIVQIHLRRQLNMVT